jgi:NADPH-dependent 2,4-dienoyl-CoA reductase/sulfur reductase-like enzyme
MSKILIIGGVAGGATAATRLRRLSEDDEIIVIERGGFVSFANCGLPYYLGGVIKDRERLLQETPESLKAKYNLDVRIHQEAVSVDPVKKSVHLRDLAGNKEYDETFDKLILSTGTTPRKISFAGLDEADNVYYLRNMEDADSIFAALSKSPRRP